MLITNVEVVPVELTLGVPYRVLYEEKVERACVVFIRVDLQDGRSAWGCACLLYTSPSPRDRTRSRMPSSA